MLIRDQSYERLRMCVVSMIRSQFQEYDDTLRLFNDRKLDREELDWSLTELEDCIEFNVSLVAALDEAAPHELRNLFGTRKWQP